MGSILGSPYLGKLPTGAILSSCPFISSCFGSRGQGANITQIRTNSAAHEFCKAWAQALAQRLNCASRT